MKRKKIVQQAVQASGLPEDVILGTPRILLRGNRILFIENHQGVVEYGAEKLRVKTQLGLLTVEGVALTLSELGEEDLMLTGTIKSISFL